MKKYLVLFLGMGIILFGCSKNDNNDKNPEPDVVCDGTTVRAEWSTDGGQNYQEAPDDQSITIEALTGEDVILGMTPDGIAFTITYQGNQVYSGSTEYALGVVTPSNNGDYIIKTAQECTTTITLNVTNGPCDDGSIRAEWSLDGGQSYEEATNSLPITIEALTGDEVHLSVLPNGEMFSVTYEGDEVFSGMGDYVLGVVDTTDSGDYIVNFGVDCSITITLNVTNVTCDASTIKAEWSLDNGLNYVEAPDDQAAAVDAFTGDEVLLSMVPNGVAFTITYQGIEVYNGDGDYVLGVVDTSDSGDYIINSVQGCTTTISLNVTDPICDGTTLRAEWSLNNGFSYQEAPDDQAVTVDAFTGDEVLLSMVPNGETFTVTYQGMEVYNGNGDYALGVVDPTNSGDYIISTNPICSRTITLNVTNAICDASTIRAEWSLDNGQNYMEAPNDQPKNVDALIGDEVLLSMVPNGVAFTITYQGVEVYNGIGDYALGAVDAADSGEYIINSNQGCSTSIILDVK